MLTVVPFSLSVLATLNSYLTAGAERGTATSTSTRPGTTSGFEGEMIVLLYVLLAIVALGAVSLGASGHVVKQFERGVVFRFGRVRPATLGPGLALVVPFVDRLRNRRARWMVRRPRAAVVAMPVRDGRLPRPVRWSAAAAWAAA